MITISGIKVVVIGACGRMGREVVKAVQAADNMQVVGAVDVIHNGEDIGTLLGMGSISVPIHSKLEEVFLATSPDVMVDFTTPENVVKNIKMAISHNIRPVVGTTGISREELAEINGLCEEKSLGCIIAPNFAIGAILMMIFAKQAARYMPHVEIIEFHHDQKLDAPSGTALKTAELITKERKVFQQGHPSEEELISGARGGEFDGMRIHSVRLPGLVAHQEVIFGDIGQTLSIRHDSINRESFMPGVVLAVSKAMDLKGVVYGLENIITE